MRGSSSVVRFLLVISLFAICWSAWGDEPESVLLVLPEHFDVEAVRTQIQDLQAHGVSVAITAAYCVDGGTISNLRSRLGLPLDKQLPILAYQDALARSFDRTIQVEASAPPPPPQEKQKVVLVVPTGVRVRVVKPVIDAFLSVGAQVTVTSPGLADAGTISSFRSKFSYPSLGVPHFAALQQIKDIHADKMLFVGDAWYDEFHATGAPCSRALPPYADQLFSTVAQAISDGTVLGGVGSGLYPLLFSGLLPAQLTVSGSACPCMVGGIVEWNLIPAMCEGIIVSERAVPSGTDVYVHYDIRQGTKLVSASVPDCWLRTGDISTDEFLTSYTAALLTAVAAMEDAHADVIGPGVYEGT